MRDDTMQNAVDRFMSTKLGKTPRKPRRSKAEIAEAKRLDYEKSQLAAAMEAAKEVASRNPVVRSLIYTMEQLVKAKRDAKLAKDGYFNKTTGEQVIPPLSEKIAKLRAKADSLEARLAVVDTLPGEIDRAISRAENIIGLACTGASVEFPADLIPEVLRSDPDMVLTAEERAGAEFHKAEGFASDE